VAEYLGMTREALLAELRKGQSLAQIARARGKSVDGLVTAMVAPVKERLAKAVASKRQTQPRADALLEGITDRLERLVQRTFAPRAA
jgi:lambda repressor-like predicted transcriptional regulator